MVLNNAPRTWVAGEIPTAGNMNGEIRDPLIGLQAPWASYTPTIVGVTTSGLVAKYHQIGKTIFGRVYFNLTATPTAAITVSLPVTGQTAIPNSQLAIVGHIAGLRQGSAFRMGWLAMMSATTVAGMSDGSGGGTWGPGAPVAWANTDQWHLTFTYEAA